jgi:hypothetical protein
MTTTLRRAAGLLVLLTALSCCACGDGRPPVYPVTGQVLANGRPAKGATITFHPVNDTPERYRPTGRVDEQGNFRLTTFAEGDGAPAGEYRVTVSWYLATRQSPTEDPVPVNYLPEKYGKPEASGLRATVSAGANTIDPFRLSR